MDGKATTTMADAGVYKVGWNGKFKGQILITGGYVCMCRYMLSGE